MVWRYRVEVMNRKDLNEATEQLRELGLERWELLSVLPGSDVDPADPARILCFFRRDASTEIGL
jgi:hypothetical protein